MLPVFDQPSPYAGLLKHSLDGAGTGQCLDALVTGQRAMGLLAPEPIRCIDSLMARNAIRRKERTEDHGRQPRHLDVRLARVAVAAGKADKG